MLVIVLFGSFFIVVAKKLSNNVSVLNSMKSFFLSFFHSKVSIQSKYLFIQCGQFAVAVKTFSSRLQNNRNYAQAMALLVVCAVKLSAVSSIVSVSEVHKSIYTFRFVT